MGQCIHLKPILSCASALVRESVLSIAHEQIFYLTKHSFLNSRIQTVFANVNGERKRERLVHAHPFGKIEVHRQVESEREREREMCSF